MAEALVDAMWRGWRDPRGAMARQMAGGLSEPRALVHLMLACGLGFLASLPNALREAQALPLPDRIEATVAAHLFAYGAVAPLLAYALAALAHLAARACGGRGGFLAARSALFWSLLLAAPVALLLALAGVGAEAAPALQPWLPLLGAAGFGFWLWLFAAGLAQAEGFARSLPVAAVVAAAFLALAGLVRLAHGSGT